MRVHTKEELEVKYGRPDPWGYQKSPEDLNRRAYILAACTAAYTSKPIGHRFARALDIGAGEGWITQDLPSNHIDAFEISDLAASRFPSNVRRVTQPRKPYDLVIATGVFYRHYDYERLQKIVYRVATGIVVTCHLEEHEVRLEGHETNTFRFQYNGKTEVRRVYDFSLS